MNHSDEIQNGFEFYSSEWVRHSTIHSQKLEYDDSDGIKTQKELFKILVKGGANLELEELSGETPLAVAMSTGNDHIVESLLESGASPLSTTTTGHNIFHYLLSASAILDVKTPYKSVKESQKRKVNRYNSIWKLLSKQQPSMKDSLRDMVSKIYFLYELGYDTVAYTSFCRQTRRMTKAIHLYCGVSIKQFLSKRPM